MPELEQAVAAAQLTPASARAAQRCLSELRDGLADDAYWRQATWKRIAVIFAGPGTNILLAILIPLIAYVIGAPGDTNRTVKKIESGTPAQAIGLRPGDTIVAVNDQPTPNFDAVAHTIRGSGGQKITVTIVRGRTSKTLGPVKPTRLNGHYALGFQPGWDTRRYGLAGALSLSLTRTWEGTKGIVTFLPRLVTRSGRKDVSSTVGIVDYSSQAISFSFTLYLEMLGLISLSLAILNLLPLLPLDGGHILFSIIEGLRGRAVGREVYERVSAIGIALFLVLMFIGLSNDITRLGGG